MLAFKLDDTALRLLDALKDELGSGSRGSVLDRAVSASWQARIAQTQNRAWCSVPTDGSRDDEILRRLHDLAALSGKSMSEVARLAIEHLYGATADSRTVMVEAPVIRA